MKRCCEKYGTAETVMAYNTAHCVSLPMSCSALLLNHLCFCIFIKSMFELFSFFSS